MVKKIVPVTENTPRLSCEQCCKEIPYSPENADYVMFFCGTECYQIWSTKNPHLQGQKVFVHSSSDKADGA